MTAELRNGHVVALATGLAYHEPDRGHPVAYYTAGVGSRTALKAIWASLVKDSVRYASLTCRPWIYRSFAGHEKHIQQFWQPLPHTQWAHAAFISDDPTLILALHPRGAQLTEYGSQAERQQLLKEAMPAVYVRFIHILNQHTEVPVLPAWGETLWWAVVEDRPDAIEVLYTHGEVLGGWLVKPAYNWLKLVQEYLHRDLIHMEKTP